MRRFILSGLIGFSGSISASTEVLWVESHFPPIVMTEGNFAGQGYTQLARQYFIERLPQFSHTYSEGALRRFFELARQQDGVCYSGIIKTPERAEFLAFSDVVYVVPSHHVVVRRSEKARFTPLINEKGEIDLAALLADPNFTTSLNPERAFSPYIDSLIRQTLPASHIEQVVQTSASFQQLAMGWLDYAIAFMEEAYWHYPKGNGVFAYFPIAHNPLWIVSHVACSDREIGRQLIAAVNEIVASAGENPPWQAFYRQWLDDTGRQRFDELLEQFLASPGN